MDEIKPDSAETAGLLEAARRGDGGAVDRLLARCRRALRAFVEVHFDPALHARLDPSDVVQDAQLEVARRMDDYLRRRPMPFHLWVRKTAYERLLKARRDHRGAARRSVRREEARPDQSSLLLARPLLSAGPSPSQQAEAREFADRVGRAVAGLPAADREILLMRHVEELPYKEIGCLLGVEPAAARKRYGRALLRLRAALAGAGLLEGQS
jgi:RNA polymerase sigma-70 factor (ECF subfamily)